MDVMDLCIMNQLHRNMFISWAVTGTVDRDWQRALCVGEGQ